ncbi:O-antigen translocase [Flavobacterium rivulicola]|uniref:O-antigen translocase n=1 Tax=Flavobacterium rivulicola TaxID=2732161 RepID=UPI0021CDFC11|nr:O-antigen translocase [Flavobacterium sp. IMCC34852]
MKFITEIRQKELFKVTSLNSISVLIKIVVGFVSSKVIALFVGPSGMALVGNLRNFVTSIESVATLGFQNGIIKYVAEYEKEPQKINTFLSTVVISILGITLLLSGFLFWTSDYLNDKIFGVNFKYQSVFRVLALCLPWYIASLFLVTVLNGFGEFKKVIKINIYGNILGLLLSVALICYWQEFGALLSVIMAPAILFFITLFFVNSKIALLKVSLKEFDFAIIKNLAEYSLMTLVAAVLGPIVYLLIRNNIIQNLGYDKAGYWEAMSRISSYYLLFLSTILTVYFLPKLSKSADNQETQKVIWSYYKGIFPVFLLGLIVLYFLKDWIIPILLTKSFHPVSALFFWQLLGDAFKAMSLILGYQFFAKKMTKAFLVTELFSLTVLWVSSTYFISVYGVEGAVIAHAVTYFVYFLTLLFYFRKTVF